MQKGEVVGEFFFRRNNIDEKPKSEEKKKKYIERLEIMFKDIADLFLNIRRKTSSLLLITNKIACICGRIVGNTEHRYLFMHA